ncbi:1-phosphatidylinositol 3-phosphate 5-kinase-like [Heterodontus francisci]|uniref:1-phosphatidylinositol 3-phosphate 5-kinase-like n=1 Tax=Heterodontus francisci TaxID=7792 RepID=UPI00355B186F
MLHLSERRGSQLHRTLGHSRMLPDLLSFSSIFCFAARLTAAPLLNREFLCSYVCEKEPSSIMAFAFSCKEYKNVVEDLGRESVMNGSDNGVQQANNADRPKTNSPARHLESCSSQGNRSSDSEQTYDGDGDKQKKHLGNPRVELQFSDANAKFYCRIYNAEEFHKMREVILANNEDDFIRSLSHCVPWQARGDKSGAAFYAAEDDRFILKQMPRLEVQSFLDFAPHYFNYITTAVQQKRPTALAKILGVQRTKIITMLPDLLSESSISCFCFREET